MTCVVSRVPLMDKTNVLMVKSVVKKGGNDLNVTKRRRGLTQVNIRAPTEAIIGNENCARSVASLGKVRGLVKVPAVPLDQPIELHKQVSIGAKSNSSPIHKDNKDKELKIFLHDILRAKTRVKEDDVRGANKFLKVVLTDVHSLARRRSKSLCIEKGELNHKTIEGNEQRVKRSKSQPVNREHSLTKLLRVELRDILTTNGDISDVNSPNESHFESPIMGVDTSLKRNNLNRTISKVFNNESQKVDDNWQQIERKGSRINKKSKLLNEDIFEVNMSGQRLSNKESNIVLLESLPQADTKENKAYTPNQEVVAKKRGRPKKVKDAHTGNKLSQQNDGKKQKGSVNKEHCITKLLRIGLRDILKTNGEISGMNSSNESQTMDVEVVDTSLKSNNLDSTRNKVFNNESQKVDDNLQRKASRIIKKSMLLDENIFEVNMSGKRLSNNTVLLENLPQANTKGNKECSPKQVVTKKRGRPKKVNDEKNSSTPKAYNGNKPMQPNNEEKQKGSEQLKKDAISVSAKNAKVTLPQTKHTNGQRNQMTTTTNNINQRVTLKDVLLEENKIQPQMKITNNANQVTKVTFQLTNSNPDEAHNLRKLVPKNYIEDSIEEDKSQEAPPLKKKDSMPIYRKLPQKEDNQPPKEDLYEFTDFSPKSKKMGKRPRNSSILFDKNMHEILKKLEKNEAKSKRKGVRKQRVQKPKYQAIVDGIVTNIKQKIMEKHGKRVEDGQHKSSSNVATNDIKPQALQNTMNIINRATSQRLQVPQTDEDPPEIIDNDDSYEENDIDTCFGFEDVPAVSTPIKKNSNINIMDNVLLKPAFDNIDSPRGDFNAIRPSANSTMLQKKASPWRSDWITVRSGRRYVSYKNNALPRIEQDMILDYTLAESCEKLAATPQKIDTPVKKNTVQQSILGYVDSNIEKRNEVVQQGSLYDYEAFLSPVKDKENKRDSARIQEVKRNVLGASTPVQRVPLADKSNSFDESNKSSNVTYFGFDVSKENIDVEDNSAAKPTRFDVGSVRKSYTKKGKSVKKKVPIVSEPLVIDKDQEKSISLMQPSNEEDIDEMHLFEEPEEILDNMSPVHIHEKRKRRKRLDSCDSDVSEDEKKSRKHKKTKLELEQEVWIKNFNKMCDEIDTEQLELE